MTGTAKSITLAVLLVAACCAQAQGQVTPPTLLIIDTENQVIYSEDTSDLSKFATDPNVTTANLARNFGTGATIADIVAVNGQPVKGTLIFNSRALNLQAAPNPGQAISDTVRANIINFTFEILKSDGTPIGTIFLLGLGAGSPPPGAPLAVIQGNNAIVGGTGAFLGARGQQGLIQMAIPSRQASITEDPANRRRNGGGKSRFVVHLIPMSRPEIIINPNGPAVVHANDFALVTAANPATAGETLILYATGLGPTRPGVDPGKPFTTTPQQVVNSPVEVAANGAPAQVLYAGGFPGSVDGYHVSFRLPAGTAPGQVSLQVTAAFIAGPEVKIAVK